MTAPRQVLPDAAVMITRRVHSRQFALRPDSDTRQLFLYLLAVGAAKYGLEILAAVCMSDHYHIVAVDVLGRHPAFTQWFNMLMGRAVNVLRGRWDTLWSGEGVDVTELVDDEAVLDRMCYALANPVQDGAVAHGREWPGARTRPQACVSDGEELERPQFFFAADGVMPEKATLKLAVPPGYREGTAGEFAGVFGQRLGEWEARAREVHLETGRPFMGAAACRAMAWQHCATRAEARGPGSRSDDVTARDRESGTLAREARDKFREAYGACWAAWRLGERAIRWPFGTWLMVVRHRVPAHSPP